METKKIIKKLSEEHDKLVKDIEEFESTIISEVVVQSFNRVRALDYVLNLLKIDNVDLGNERTKLLTFFKAGSIQAMPIDLLQIVHRLQVLFYTNKLFQMEDEDDTSN